MPQILYVTAEIAGKPNTFAQTLETFNENGGGLLILDPLVPQEPLPVELNKNIWTIDLRYNNALHLVLNQHPRLDGFWPQYTNLETGLRDNVVISKIVTAEEPAPTSENDTFYRNFLSESAGFNALINTVAIWGDSGGFVPGAKVWGGFLSARSWPKVTKEWKEETHEWPSSWTAAQTLTNDTYKDFDVALTGLEINVENNGKPTSKAGLWTYIRARIFGPELAKIGLQIVGFGQTNTTAIEVRSNDTDNTNIPDSEKTGTFMTGLLFAENALHKDAITIETRGELLRKGLDFAETLFTQGAIIFHAVGEGTGLVFNEGKSGEFFAPFEESRVMAIRSGKSGIQVLTNDQQKTPVAISNNGEISFHGTIFINGTTGGLETAPKDTPHAVLVMLAAIVLLVTGGFTWRLSHQLRHLNHS